MDIIAMEVTKEEMEKILRDRAESARTAEIDECGEVIKHALDRIHALGGEVYTFDEKYRGHNLNSTKLKVYHVKH